MNDATILGLLIGGIAALALSTLAYAIVHGLREWAWQRETERRYSDEWVAARRHQHDDRHMHDNPERPE